MFLVIYSIIGILNGIWSMIRQNQQWIVEEEFFYSLLRYITVFLLNSIFWFITIPYSIFKGNFLPKKGDKRKIWINKTDLK